MSVKRSVLTIAMLLSQSIYAQEPEALPSEESAVQSPEEPAEESLEDPAAEPSEEPAVELSEELSAVPPEDPIAPETGSEIGSETSPEAVRSSQQDRPPELPEEPADAERPAETVEVGEQRSERIVSPWATVLPFGIPQFVQGESKRGWIYASVQAVGVGLSIYTGLEMRRLAEEGEVDRELTYRLVSAGTVAVTALTWFGSVVDGSNMRIESIERAHSAREWESTQRPAIVLVLE